MVARYAIGAVFAALGCGGGGKAAERPALAEARVTADPDRTDPHRADAPPVADETDGDGLEVEGTRGHLAPHQIEDGVRPHQRALTGCYRDELRRSKWLGGAVELAVVVAESGAVEEVRLARSDLGSWAVERCLLETARAMRFPAPRGGAADFRLPLAFDSGRGSIVWWEEEQADREVQGRLQDLEACDVGEARRATDVAVTLYVGNRGKVKSVGFASPSRPIVASWADCASQAIADWTLSDPRGRIAKAGFRYRPE